MFVAARQKPLCRAGRVAMQSLPNARRTSRTKSRVAALIAVATIVLAGRGQDRPRIEMREARLGGNGPLVRHGRLHVFEDRAARAGRRIALDVIVLPALQTPAAPDPVFVIMGGPGQSATAAANGWANHWMRRERDIVFVDQRGTGGDHRLSCAVPGDDDDLQGYLDPMFDEAVFRACLAELSQRADLRHYSTPEAMDDLNDARIALGYEKINLYGGSYGSRAELVYLRRHPQTVRCAIMNSVAPLAFKNPLYHAKSLQLALEKIFTICETDPRYRKDYGNLRRELESVLERLQRNPAPAVVRHPTTGEPTPVRVSRETFLEALRVIMYVDYRDVPRLIHRASRGEFDELAQQGLERNRALRRSLAFGMLLCVTCAEDLDRITPAEIERETQGTYAGDVRVRAQMNICRFWPRSHLPADFGKPVSAETPVLLLSGTLDSVTPPRWGAEAARHLPNATHVVAPGSHGLHGPCIDRIIRAFLDDPTRRPDLSCVNDMKLAPFNPPD
ncbi:MAG: alpha/beta hydrolase [Planctomycetota bacterium]|nr:MAG: alpha/beta hydrolase [Planctomycetota bacterium]